MRTAEVTVKISRYGFETVTLTFDHEPTLEEALQDANYDLSASEKSAVNGVPATLSSILENGDTVQIVGKKEGGIK